MGIETPYRAVRTAVGRKRWRHRGHLLRAAMPALAQIIVLTALLLQRQWLFALMVSSGIFGMLASFTLTYTPILRITLPRSDHTNRMAHASLITTT